MIQKCPECGQWCEAGKDGYIDKAWRGFNDAAEGGGAIGASIGRRIFGKKGETVGAVVGGGAVGGSGLGFVNAGIEFFLGDDYQFVCPNCGHKWSTNNPEDDQTEEYERNEAIVDLCDKYPSIIHASEQEKQEYIKELQRQLSYEGGTDAQSATLYDTMAAAYQLIGDKNKALKAVNSSLALFDDDNTRVLKGVIMGKGRNAQDTYAAMQEVIHFKSEERTESPFLSTSQIEEEFSLLQSSYAQNFLSLPLQQRKHLVVCNELTYLPDSFRVLPIAEIPTDVKFPAGHPVSNTLYVCHPYRTDLYIPYDTYEVEILRDEIEEFKTIMDHLGAKHIDYSDIFENDEESNAQHKREIHGSGDYAGQYSAHGSYDAEESSDIRRKLRSSLEGSEDFLLAGKPTIPRDLVWYDHRMDWQRKCESRLAGRLVHSEFTISTSSSEMTTESERKKIEADLNILLVKAEGGKEGGKIHGLKREKERTWKVNVEFYPLSDYEKKETSVIVPVVENGQPIQESSSKKSINVIWIMGAIIAFLFAVIVCLLIF